MPYIKALVFIMFILPLERGSGKYYTFTADPSRDKIEMFWKDDNGKIFETFDNLRDWVNKRGRRLRFATNGGMFMEDLAPLGLYVENGRQLRQLNTRKGKTNFYIQPQGVFCITYDNKAFICKADEFHQDGNIKYATQSAPMLVINRNINNVLDSYKSSQLIRSGVGILPDGRVVFALSKEMVSFYEFAQYFHDLKCVNAMFLDGNISEMYLPEQKLNDCQGGFGVIIAVTD